MADNIQSERKSKLGILFWITLIRGFMALILGLSLIFIPEKTKSTLFNFMGMFWLMGGFVLVRQELHKRGHRLVLAAGFLGVLAGIAVVTRNLTRQYVDEFWVVEILGAVILLTGILHILGGFQFYGVSMHGRTVLSVMLGIFEILLGGALMLLQKGQSPLLYAIAIVWAMLGGIFLFGDALRQYRTHKSKGSPISNS
jgi:uncharacterized membrane protein HdeD (DUF308 family)